MHDLCWAPKPHFIPPSHTHPHECSKTKDHSMLGCNTHWSINDKSHSFLHPSYLLFIPVSHWVNVIGCWWWERAEKRDGGWGGCFWARQGSPIRLILEWRGKQRLSRQQLAGGFDKKAGKRGAPRNLFVFFRSVEVEVCTKHSHMQWLLNQ